MSIRKLKTLPRREREAHRAPRLRPGAAPGILKIDPRALETKIEVICFGPEELSERLIENLEQINECLGQHPVIWVNVEGLGNEEALRAVADIFDLHPLAMEDVVNTRQRAKAEEYPGHLYFVCRMPVSKTEVDTEQVSIFLGENFVITFQEGREGDCFESARKRLRQSRGRLRSQGADYLAYTLIDAVVDHYLPLLETFDARLDELEDEILADPEGDAIARIYVIKRELLSLRRYLWPLRDALAWLLREEGTLIQERTRLYLRDCEDHAIRIIELAENQRELAASLMDLHLLLGNHKLNEAIQALTVIATIFMPASFIAAVYG
jgi:magnesium transporter